MNLVRGTSLLITFLMTASLAAGAEKESWSPLFNGKDLSGWIPMHGASFVVTNNALRLATGMGWLRTEREYTNFVVEIEWRALEGGYDSGIFIRTGSDGAPWPDGAWQINLARTALGGLVKGKRTVVPAETPPVPVNVWTTFRITVRDRTVRLEVNGENAWSFDGLDASRGFIGIQAENKAFEFRRIQIREL